MQVTIIFKGGPYDGEVVSERLAEQGQSLTIIEEANVILAYHQTNGGEIGKRF